jgi:hypothetical protein
MEDLDPIQGIPVNPIVLTISSALVSVPQRPKTNTLRHHLSSNPESLRTYISIDMNPSRQNAHSRYFSVLLASCLSWMRISGGLLRLRGSC